VYANELRDDFNSDTHNWSYTDMVNGSSIYISNGYLFYTSHPSTSTAIIQAGVASGIGSPANFLLETSISSDNVMGLSFGFTSTIKGYSFKINGKGQFAVYNEGDSTHTAMPIIEWRASNAISMTTMNILKLEQVGDVWNGYINAIQVFSTTARPLLSNEVGFMMASGTNGQSDYLDIKW
jgi:hypothetical protein